MDSLPTESEDSDVLCSDDGDTWHAPIVEPCPSDEGDGLDIK